MRTQQPRSIGWPILLGSISVALAIAMLVAWILVLVWSDRFDDETWLLVLGIISLSFIGLVLGGFMVLLVREIREVRRQTNFIDSVTHELKSPLASLRLCLDTLERPGVSPGQAEALRGMMKGDIQRLAAFIDDVLIANRLGPGSEHAAVPVNLAEHCGRAVARVMAHHRAPPDAVLVDIPPALTLRSDPTAVETILANLVDNALKYSDPPARVRVTARVVGAMVEISVADRGIGLPPGARSRIFQRFYRVPNEAVARRHGTGLGLFVVAGLVRNLRGRIEALSPGAGAGTTFLVRLPLGGAAALDRADVEVRGRTSGPPNEGEVA